MFSLESSVVTPRFAAVSSRYSLFCLSNVYCRLCRGSLLSLWKVRFRLPQRSSLVSGFTTVSQLSLQGSLLSLQGSLLSLQGSLLTLHRFNNINNYLLKTRKERTFIYISG
jgi:hypothetical protein